MSEETKKILYGIMEIEGVVDVYLYSDAFELANGNMMVQASIVFQPSAPPDLGIAVGDDVGVEDHFGGVE